MILVMGKAMIRVNLMPKTDPDKTHKFEMDIHGNLEHSDSCWCLTGISASVKKEEPDDNDGRETCFWCGKKTIKKELFTSSYDICDSCGK